VTVNTFIFALIAAVYNSTQEKHTRIQFHHSQRSVCVRERVKRCQCLSPSGVCVCVCVCVLPAGLVRRVSLGQHVHAALEEPHVPLAQKIYLIKIRHHHHHHHNSSIRETLLSARHFRFRCANTRQNKSLCCCCCSRKLCKTANLHYPEEKLP